MNGLIDRINEAKKYVKGELELNNFDGKWYAMDYIETSGGSFQIANGKYNEPLITDEEAKRLGVDVAKCCDLYGVFHVG